MKLQPRERRQRQDYIVENAAALQLGKLYLGWGRGKARLKSKRATPTVESKQKVAKTSPRAPAKKKVHRNPATPVLPVAKRRPGRPRKTSPPAARVESTPIKSKSCGRPPTTPAKAPRKPTARESVRSGKKLNPTVKPLSSKAVAAVGNGDRLLCKPPPRAPRETAAVLTTKTVVQHRRRANRNTPPVIPNPVPTPALSLGEAEEAADGSNVSVLVRTMNGTSFGLACTFESTLYDLKRRILEIIMPCTASASPAPAVRMPMLVMNGRALGPETATLAALRFPAQPTVYCFPEPG
ncbi:hypothetical protein Q4I28_007506 [Leishmania naiffi]|uniref:Ubiquitin-like domain-containing protein n=1 Tax=Leishmania naiffi TaxID=5678 RepID=A0AAW3BAH9_9TRYP